MNSASTFEKSAERAKRSESTPDPGSLEKVRRTRDAIPVTRSISPKIKSNSHDAGRAGANGHGPVSPSRAAPDTRSPLEKGRAASDDARDLPAAATASSALAGKERDACAEVAQAPEGEKKSRPRRSKEKAGPGTSRVPSDDKVKKDKGTNPVAGEENDKSNTVHIPPGSEPLTENGPGFVDAIHKHVDLCLACARLLKSKDEKIAQRMVERLLEMKYGKASVAALEEAPEIVIDIDSAVTRRAAEGANK